MAGCRKQDKDRDVSKVLFIADEISEDALEFLAVADNLEVDNRPGLSIPEKLEAVGKADALIVRSATKVDAELLEAAPSLARSSCRCRR